MLAERVIARALNYKLPGLDDWANQLQIVLWERQAWNPSEGGRRLVWRGRREAVIGPEGQAGVSYRAR